MRQFTNSSCQKLTVLLDLDGTLVSSFTPRRAPRLPPSVRTHLVAKGSQLNPQGVFVVERPGLQQFLQELNKFATVVIFTAGLEEYARPIVSAIDPNNNYFSGVIYRDGCLKTEYYQCVKDIAVAGYHLPSTVLVDDTPLAFLHQPDNGVPVLPFRGDPDDQLLMEAVLPFLQGLAGAQDVQNVLRERFDMSKWFKRHGYPVNRLVNRGEPKSEDSSSTCAPAAMDTVQSDIKDAKQCEGASDGEVESSSPQPQSPKHTSTLLLCDFDKTLTDFDAGERLFETLAPELVPMLQAIEMPANFIPITNTLLSEISRRGVSRNLLLSTLQDMGADLPGGTVRMLRHANATANVSVKVLSDCNRIFIAHMLAGAKAGNLVQEVLTNPAGFERVEDDAGNMGLGASSTSRVGRKGYMQKLVITPRHASHFQPHGCCRCPENLCKGAEVDRLRAQKPKERIIYCGDGQNDVCPALRLRPGDFVFARDGCALAKFLIADADSDARQFKGSFKVWENHEQLADMVTELL